MGLRRRDRSLALDQALAAHKHSLPRGAHKAGGTVDCSTRLTKEVVRVVHSLYLADAGKVAGVVGGLCVD